MLAVSVRSGITEASHEISAVVIDEQGRRIASWGDPDAVLFLRSAAKPIQATVSQESGANLPPEWLAIAAASHGGHPVHLGIVRSMLEDSGLAESDLRCPGDWPLSARAKTRLIAGGRIHQQRVYHNCSGKHAAWLRACVANGWPRETYLDPVHPIQQRILALTQEITGVDPSPVGVDGCGAPVLRSSLSGLARAFSSLSLGGRYADVADAMSRFPALVADNIRADGRIAAWWGGPLKAGAEGLLAAGRHGIGIAVKSATGSGSAAAVGMMEAARQVGLLPTVALEALADVAAEPVHGGGHIVGSLAVDASTAEPDDQRR